MEPPAAAICPTYRANGSGHFTHDEDIIAHGLIISGPTVVVSDPEAIGPFNKSFINNRSLIWDNMVSIFQGTDAWKYLNPANKYSNGIMGYMLIYNHYLGPSNIYHMAAGAKNKIAQCT